MQYNVFGSKHRSNVQGNEENVEVRNGDEFPDFVDLFFFFFDIKNVKVGSNILGLTGNAHIFFFGLSTSQNIFKYVCCTTFVLYIVPEA